MPTRYPDIMKACLAIPLLLFLAPGIAAAEDNSAAPNEAVGDYLKDFLSDPRRVGSLSGSVIGGALTAHPAGPVLGSLLGFFIGKHSQFKESQPADARRQLATKGIIPAEAPQGTPTLSLSDPGGLSFAAGPSSAPAAMPPSLSMPSAQGISPSLLAQTQTLLAQAQLLLAQAQPQPQPMTGSSFEQIAALCRNGGQATNPRLKSLCFYNQTN